jgi:deoxycytidine triphosphate deaminase
MSIWNDVLLHDYCNRCALVAPFDAANVNPASIDLRLGASYRLPHPMWQSSTRVAVGDPAHVATLPTWGDECTMPPEGLVIYPGQFILCCSMETVCIPNDACAFLVSKSSMGRVGLEHLHAGLGDPGFCGQWTWELHSVAPWPILLLPGKRYMQMVVHDLVAPAARDYSQTGRYQNQTGATPAREAR